MKTFLCLAISIAFACSDLGATHTAASASYSDVDAARALCSAGDILAIPAGTNDWSTSQLLVTKAITIRGAGTNLAGADCTFIYGTGPATGMINWKIDSDAPARITSLVMSNTAATSMILFKGTNASGGNFKITQARVDHCTFMKGKRAVDGTGYCYGVVDHCGFYNCDIAISPNGDNAKAWARSMNLGDTNVLCIEDNYFSVIQFNANQQVYHQEGGRSTIRFNNFDSKSNVLYDSPLLDSHGNWSNGNGIVDPDSPLAYTAQSQPTIEIYSNTFAIYKSYEWSDFRGGTTLMFSNAFTVISGTGGKIFHAIEEEAWSTTLFSPLRTVWPAGQQITNTFLWSNTQNGSATGTNIVSITTGRNEETFIQQNRDYWLEAPNATNGAPAGIYNGYTPLIYPHPLVRSQDGVAPVISAIASQTGPMNTIIGPVSFTITDANSWENISALTPSGTSDNHTLLLDNGIAFGGSGANRTVTLTPVGSQNGTAIVTISVTDSDNLTGTRSFTNVITSSDPGPKAVSVGNFLTSRILRMSR